MIAIRIAARCRPYTTHRCGSLRQGGGEVLARSCPVWSSRGAGLGAAPSLVLSVLTGMEMPFDVPFESLLSLPSRPQGISLGFLIKLEGGEGGKLL